MTESSKTWQPRDVHRAGRPIPCRQVLTRLPGRVLTFLHAAATRPEIRSLLRDAGYSASDHEEGSRLLMAVTAYAPSVGTAVEHDGLVNQAQREIADWVRVHLPRFRCIIEHHHPEALDLFETSEASTPLGALPALALWLGRLRALAAQRTRSSKRLFETLARRGLDAAERARLEGQVRRAQSAPEVGDALVGRDARLDELMALLAWYRDWAMTAKFQIQSRRHLIALGLAERGRRGAVEAELEWEAFDEPSEPGGGHGEPPEAPEWRAQAQAQAQAQCDSPRGQVGRPGVPPGLGMPPVFGVPPVARVPPVGEVCELGARAGGLTSKLLLRGGVSSPRPHSIQARGIATPDATRGGTTAVSSLVGSTTATDGVGSTAAVSPAFSHQRSASAIQSRRSFHRTWKPRNSIAQRQLMPRAGFGYAHRRVAALAFRHGDGQPGCHGRGEVSRGAVPGLFRGCSGAISAKKAAPLRTLTRAGRSRNGTSARSSVNSSNHRRYFDREFGLSTLPCMRCQQTCTSCASFIEPGGVLRKLIAGGGGQNLSDDRVLLNWA